MSKREEKGAEMKRGRETERKRGRQKAKGADRCAVAWCDGAALRESKK